VSLFFYYFISFVLMFVDPSIILPFIKKNPTRFCWIFLYELQAYSSITVVAELYSEEPQDSAGDNKRFDLLISPHNETGKINFDKFL